MKKLTLLIIIGFVILTVNAQTKKEGEVVKSKNPVKEAELLPLIKEHISANYAGYKFQNAFKIQKEKTFVYRVRITKNDSDNILLSYDNEGKFLKKMENVNKPSTNQKGAKQSKNKENLKIKKKPLSTTPLN